MIDLNCTIKGVKADLVTNQVTLTFSATLDTDYILQHPELQHWAKSETPLGLTLRQRFPKQLPLPALDRPLESTAGWHLDDPQPTEQPEPPTDTQVVSPEQDTSGELTTIFGLCPDCRQIQKITVAPDQLNNLPIPDDSGVYPADMAFLCDACQKPPDEAPPAPPDADTPGQAANPDPDPTD